MSDADVGPTVFLDANILVYAFTDDPRATEAKRLLSGGCVIGIQGLNEFANVAGRKLRRSWPEIENALSAIRSPFWRTYPSTSTSTKPE